jgi:hypothetical protein
VHERSQRFRQLVLGREHRSSDERRDDDEVLVESLDNLVVDVAFGAPALPDQREDNAGLAELLGNRLLAECSHERRAQAPRVGGFVFAVAEEDPRHPGGPIPKQSSWSPNGTLQSKDFRRGTPYPGCRPDRATPAWERAVGIAQVSNATHQRRRRGREWAASPCRMGSMTPYLPSKRSRLKCA